MPSQNSRGEARLWAIITGTLTVIGLVIGYLQLQAANHPPQNPTPPTAASTLGPNQSVNATGAGAVAIGQVNGNVTAGGDQK